MTFRFAPYTESHGRNGINRIELVDGTWEVILRWRHVATFFKRRDAREFIRAAKVNP